MSLRLAILDDQDQVLGYLPLELTDTVPVRTAALTEAQTSATVPSPASTKSKPAAKLGPRQASTRRNEKFLERLLDKPGKFVTLTSVKFTDKTPADADAFITSRQASFLTAARQRGFRVTSHRTKSETGIALVAKVTGAI